MPVIIVYGIREGEELDIPELRKKLRENIANIEELKLSENQISCIFPAEYARPPFLFEKIVFVRGLFARAERTPEVRSMMARAIVAVIKQFSPNDFVECFVEPFNMEEGFASSEV
ncbi:hypothetical protein KKC32_02450 [Patescibacteria group bacterium]|nr:hypothetical protein [Patescibacteria group bacterium]